MAWLHDQRCRIKEHASGSPTSISSCIEGIITPIKTCPFYIRSDISKKNTSGASHRAIHKDDLAKLDEEYRRLMRMVVGPPADTNWVSPWHDILHGWNNKVQMLQDHAGTFFFWTETLVCYMHGSSLEICILCCNFTPERWSGPAGFSNGTSEDHGNVGDQPTLRKERCKNTPSGNALTIGLWRLLQLLHMKIKC